MSTSRKVICADAIEWLQSYAPEERTSFVASLPDISEFPQHTLEQWKEWFCATARLILSRSQGEGVTVFYQSDIKHDGQWVDKGYLCQKAAELEGHRLLWHKIACRAPAGVTTFGRPAYSHILCFSKNLRIDVSRSTSDVLPELGEKTWQRGMGLEAALMIARFIKEEAKSATLINPFCGEGSILAAGNALGLNTIGIEKGKKWAEKARALSVSEDLKHWL